MKFFQLIMRFLSLKLLLLSFVQCSHQTKILGGGNVLAYDDKKNYSLSELEELSPYVIQTKKRNPKFFSLDDLFSQQQPPLKRLGIVVFETTTQQTLSGLAEKDLIYLSNAGKQKLANKLFSIWEQSLDVIAPDLFISSHEILHDQVAKNYGTEEENYVKSFSSSFFSSDLFYLKSGQKTSTRKVMNPSGFRDFSLLLVPAYDLMGGPKWSTYQNHFINEIAKKYSLDGVVIISSQINWQAKGSKRGVRKDEELHLILDASVLIPFGSYFERSKKLNPQMVNNLPKSNVCFRAYSSQLKIPLNFSEKPQSFSVIENDLLNPLFKSYTELSQMMMITMVKDLDFNNWPKGKM